MQIKKQQLELEMEQTGSNLGKEYNKAVYHPAYLTYMQSVLVAQPCPTLWPHRLHSLPGSSIHGILQARLLEWVPSPFSRGIFLTQG